MRGLGPSVILDLGYTGGLLKHVIKVWGAPTPGDSAEQPVESP